MKYIPSICLVCLVILTAPAIPCHAGVPEIGFEIDVLPWATGGYYGSVWAGQNGWRARGVISHVKIPSFVTDNGFHDSRSTAGALLIDRFFGAYAHDLRGPWIGGGIEYWHNSISRDGFSRSVEYDGVYSTVGVGYCKQLWRGFYINPWAAGHLRISGDDTVAVSGKTYRPPALLFEMSVKIGRSVIR